MLFIMMLSWWNIFALCGEVLQFGALSGGRLYVIIFLISPYAVQSLLAGCFSIRISKTYLAPRLKLKINKKSRGAKGEKS